MLAHSCMSARAPIRLRANLVRGGPLRATQRRSEGLRAAVWATGARTRGGTCVCASGKGTSLGRAVCPRRAAVGRATGEKRSAGDGGRASRRVRAFASCVTGIRRLMWRETEGERGRAEGWRSREGARSGAQESARGGGGNIELSNTSRRRLLFLASSTVVGMAWWYVRLQ